MKRKLILFLLLIFTACSSNNTSQPIGTETRLAETEKATATIVSTSTATESAPPGTATSQPLFKPVSHGPDEFPEGYNPLTGQPVSDPSWLEYPAILLSVSHFPPEARPQAGFSFTPLVYEYYITEGSTRHLAVVYGEFPEPEIPLHGDCAVRAEPVTQTGMILGNRVWHDKNQNGVQEPREDGIGGICVNLLDEGGTPLQQTTTDSNGYYGFNVEMGRYLIDVEKPDWLEFTKQNVGDDAEDSDMDQASGRMGPIDVSDSSLLFWDAGLVTSSAIAPAPDPSLKLPAAEVGPIRSGRIFYKYMGAMYQDSCMIYASADPVVLAQIPKCAMVGHAVNAGGVMLSLERMAGISEQNKKANPDFEYASNLFSEEAPSGGEPATELWEYWALLNQSKWIYDGASESWWRYIDDSRLETVGEFHRGVDRLNGRQLQFENVILMFADHIVIRPTIVDINLAPGNQGNAYLFRNGKIYNIKWSTVPTEYQEKTGRGQPLRFLNLDGTPAALKPGHTWVIIFDLQSYLEEVSPGFWKARFVAPAGAKNE